MRQDRKGAAELARVVADGVGYQCSFRLRLRPSQTDQQHACKETPLAEDQFAEVPVGCDEDCRCLTAKIQNEVVRDSRLQFRDVQHRVPIAADATHNLFIHTPLIGYRDSPGKFPSVDPCTAV